MQISYLFRLLLGYPGLLAYIGFILFLVIGFVF